MNTRQIVNLGFPTLDEHCATNEYVDRMFNHLRSQLLTRAATSQPDEPNPAVTSTGIQPLNLTSQTEFHNLTSQIEFHSLTIQMESQLQAGLQRHIFVFCERDRGQKNWSNYFPKIGQNYFPHKR